METRVFDWKDVANAQFDKALSFAVLVLLFCVLVTPRVDMQKQKFSVQQMQAIELPPEEREKIKPPEDIAKPVVDIVISDELTGDQAQDPSMIEAAINQLGGGLFDTNIVNKASGDERPFEFVPYDDPPEPINPIAPEYTDFAKKARVQGIVVLEVDVYRDGSIGKITVKTSLLGGPNGLDEAAINAVKKWKFQPGKSSGKAVDTTVIIPIEFNLSRN